MDGGCGRVAQIGHTGGYARTVRDGVRIAEEIGARGAV